MLVPFENVILYTICIFLNLLGVFLLYHNRKDLLCEEGRLSLGRIWSWIIFYISISYWVRYILGVIPESTPFPPLLNDLVYVCFIYELARKGLSESILNIIFNRKK